MIQHDSPRPPARHRRWMPSLRRTIQAACFLLYLILFFYVCWPYGARPTPPRRLDSGWRLERLEQSTGNIHMRHAAESESATLSAGGTVYVVDEDANDPADGVVGAMTVVAADADRLVLQPQDELADAALDAILLHDVQWSFYDRPPAAIPSHFADWFAHRERIPADLILCMDPLVGLSTMMAGRCWVSAVAIAIAVLVCCVVIPRAFCGYICPLGTVIDIFDSTIGRHIRWFRLKRSGGWVHAKYVILAATLLAAAMGVLVSGCVAAIPVLTRAMMFAGEPIQTSLLRGAYLIPPTNSGHVVALILFVAILSLGLLRRRFWCAYLCPSGALFSLNNVFRFRQRKVQATCIRCNKCVQACPFDAIQPDFHTRTMDCTYCQTCGSVCPTDAIVFVGRQFQLNLKPAEPDGENPRRTGRRRFLTGAAASVAGGIGGAAIVRAFGSGSRVATLSHPVRPPGSVPEDQFLQLCIRCAECFKVCPNNVLQPVGFEQGLEGLWTPRVNADWAGCEPSCNACGHVCPTGAIHALPLEEKRITRIGLAEVRHDLCLPWANRDACQLCVDECRAIGYDAIEFEQVHTEFDASGEPVPGTGYLAPSVLPDRCVGCGLCQTRCYAINVKAEHFLPASAIVVYAGPDKEDRCRSDSAHRLSKLNRQSAQQRKPSSALHNTQPNVPATETSQSDASDTSLDLGDDPFGLGEP